MGDFDLQSLMNIKTTKTHHKAYLKSSHDGRRDGSLCSTSMEVREQDGVEKEMR